MMSRSLYQRVLDYALANQHRPVWKRRLYGLLYGMGLRKLSQIKEDDNAV